MRTVSSVIAACLTSIMAVGGYAESIAAWHNSSKEFTVKGTTSVDVSISEPMVVAVAAEQVGWGFHQFPTIARWKDGRLAVTYNMARDAAESYGLPTPVMVSSDEGETWKPHTGALGVAGLLLPNGDRIEISTPRPYKTNGLRLPEPITPGTSQFRLHELPPKLRTIRISRIEKGSSERIVQHASLFDPQALRGGGPEIFPIIWWGDMRVASDGSVIAGIYPGRYIRDDGTVEPKCCVFFYRSTDFGRSWKIQGRIPYEFDLKADPKGDKRGGFTEPAFEILKDGTFLCIARTTDGNGIGPMYASRSKDLGRTWSKPEALTPNGVLPRLLRLENGVLVLASGRPGVQLRFSTDGKGKRWTDPCELGPITSSNLGADTCGYTSLLATGPDTFLIAYSHFKHSNEKGELRKAILVREVRVKRR